MIVLDSVPLTYLQLVQFLGALAGDGGVQYSKGGRCKNDFTYTRKILTQMRISLEDQEQFIELCKNNGGYCDCEILMNAAPILLGEETPW